jgi:hypothetical protein
LLNSRRRGIEHRPSTAPGAASLHNNASIILGLLFGSLGVGYFLYGRKQRQPLAFACGLMLIVFPYFITHISLLITIGLVLSVLPFLLRR